MNKFEQVYSDDHQISLAREQAWEVPDWMFGGVPGLMSKDWGDFPGLMSKGVQAGGSGLYNEVQCILGNGGILVLWKEWWT